MRTLRTSILLLSLFGGANLNLCAEPLDHSNPALLRIAESVGNSIRTLGSTLGGFSDANIHKVRGSFESVFSAQERIWISKFGRSGRPLVSVLKQVNSLAKGIQASDARRDEQNSILDHVVSVVVKAISESNILSHIENFKGSQPWFVEFLVPDLVDLVESLSELSRVNDQLVGLAIRIGLSLGQVQYSQEWKKMGFTSTRHGLFALGQKAFQTMVSQMDSRTVANTLVWYQHWIADGINLDAYQTSLDSLIREITGEPRRRIASAILEIEQANLDRGDHPRIYGK